MNKRGKGLIINLLFFITLALIASNVFLVTVPGYHVYTKENLKTYTQNLNYSEDTIFARRGNIYDNDGTLLATDTQSYNLVAYLSNTRMDGKKPAYVVDKENTANELSTILDMSPKEILAYLNRNLYQTEFGTKSRNLTLNQKRAIENLKLPGIGFINSFSRAYPKGNLASNLLGLASYDEQAYKTLGKFGVELLFDAELKGENGTRVAQKDKYGYIIDQATVTIDPAIHGNDIYLTIDQTLQETLEASFKLTQRDVASEVAFGIVMEAKTGKVLAVGQSPALDLKNPIDNYLNYPLLTTFEPGSTMKAFSYSAYIDQGFYDETRKVPTRVFYVGSDNGKLFQSKVPTRHGRVTNANQRDWGLRSLDESFPLSLNTVTSMMVAEMGADSYLDYLKNFGFLTPVNTNRFLDPAGTIAYKYPLEQINTSFGQAITVSALQLLQGYSAIVTDGTMVKPYFVDKIVDPSTKETIYTGSTTIVGNPIKESTAKKMQQLMRDVIAGPYYYHNYGTENVDIIAKTGTAQVADPKGGYSKDKTLHNIVMALPAEDPQFLIFYGYITKAGVARLNDTREAHRNIVDAITVRYLRHQQQDDKVDHNNEIREIVLPQLINHTFNYAKSKMEDLNVKLVKLGQGDQIIAQLPLGDTTMFNNETVFLKMDNQPLTMIDLTGLTRKEVTNFARLANISLTIEGEGVVKSQSIKVNQEIKENDTLHIVLK